MNSKTVRLLRSYARSSGMTLKSVKREWATTPRNDRGDVRKEMERSLWRRKLQEFRKAHQLSEKEAAGQLSIPYDTWRSWEMMKHTPARWVQISLSTVMRLYDPNQATPNS